MSRYAINFAVTKFGIGYAGTEFIAILQCKLEAGFSTLSGGFSGVLLAYLRCFKVLSRAVLGHAQS
jgi:hypothetical protein